MDGAKRTSPLVDLIAKTQSEQEAQEQLYLSG